MPDFDYFYEKKNLYDRGEKSIGKYVIFSKKEGHKTELAIINDDRLNDHNARYNVERIVNALNNMAELTELKNKIKIYERLLHQLQMYYEVVLDSNKVKKLLDNIARWSYAHRQGNGEENNELLVKNAFDKLLEL